MSKNGFFSIYDKLINGIPSGINIINKVRGKHWTLVQSEDSLGVAKTFTETLRSSRMGKSIIGEDLREIAKLSKSWNFSEASLGLAAINCYYNSEKKIKRKELLEDGDAFDIYREKVKDKIVSVIGHFPFLESQLKDICDLRILEREPQKGDYPDSACEVLLPESDYIFITSCTIANKTFPRLL